MKTILIAVAIAMNPEPAIEEVELTLPARIATMCQAEGGCALVTRRAMNERAVRMYSEGAMSASLKKGCGT